MPGGDAAPPARRSGSGRVRRRPGRRRRVAPEVECIHLTRRVHLAVEVQRHRVALAGVEVDLSLVEHVLGLHAALEDRLEAERGTDLLVAVEIRFEVERHDHLTGVELDLRDRGDLVVERRRGVDRSRESAGGQQAQGEGRDERRNETAASVLSRHVEFSLVLALTDARTRWVRRKFEQTS